VLSWIIFKSGVSKTVPSLWLKNKLSLFLLVESSKNELKNTTCLLSNPLKLAKVWHEKQVITNKKTDANPKYKFPFLKYKFLLKYIFALVVNFLKTELFFLKQNKGLFNNPLKLAFLIAFLKKAASHLFSIEILLIILEIVVY